ncbi:BRICHOS-like domain-containing protein out at first [Rhodnius prolixus]|uniref:BRICHOS-like domain-containing protein out at first n=1 Tax=Rhodnius prolixus TaxID=13249 RepID=UPI003D18B21A
MLDDITRAARLLQLCSLLLFTNVNTQLLINVKNQGGDVLQETITANVTDDTVMLEFQRTDGTLITQLIDFRTEVQVLKALVLGEEERGQSQYQVMCFVCHVNKDEFISSDAMSKLRQKNPGTLRTPEIEKEKERYDMDMLVEVARSGVLSRHVHSLCTEASDATYTRRTDIDHWTSLPRGPSRGALMLAARKSPGPSPRCREAKGLWTPCTCHLETCIGWYPCGLKYCRAKDGTSYRCGIRTCRKCHLYTYHVRQKQLCLWDE